MRPTNEIDIIFLIEVFNDNLSECVRYPAVILAPINHVFLGVGWVGPEQVAEEAAVRHVSWTQDLVDLLQIV